jgi:hypothetical protein
MRRWHGKGRRALAALLLATTVAAGAGLVAGCGNDRSSEGTSTARGAAAAPDGHGDAQGGAQVGGQSGAQGGAGANGSSGKGSTTTGAVADPRNLIIMAGLQLAVKNPDEAAARAEQAVLTAGGYVAAEAEGAGPQTMPSANTGADNATAGVTGVSPMTLPAADAASGSDQVLLQLRVPPAHLSSVLATLSGGGRVAYRTQSETDVTGQVADVASRVGSAQASITELRGMIDKAASMNDLISLEQALAGRESDLESLEAQQRALADQVAYATVTVGYYVPAGQVVAATPAGGHRNPFLAGLSDSWHALGAAFHGLLAAAGWLLPFAVLLALLWWPVRRLRRTWWRRRPEHRTE